MKKLLQSLFILMFVAVTAMAQDRTITGTVTSKDDGLPIPGVSVTITGAKSGTQTSADGKFSLSVPSGTSSLKFSFLGFQTQTVAIPSSGVLRVSLASDQQQLGEVVITGALGIQRQKKELGYAATSVNNETITAGNAVNVANGLQGKVSGLNITTTNSGVFENVKINLRGIRSLTGNNNPLLLLDGVQSDINYLSSLNPNDIEDVTVLKGSAGAAVYGSDARNGVIIVTTKKGTKDGKPVVTVSNSTQFQDISFFPKFQEKFGLGGGGNNAVGGQYTPIENWSWGPAYDGSTIDIGPDLTGVVDPRFGPLTTQTETYSNKNSRKDFFNTGSVIQNDVSYGDKNFYLSLQDANIKGIVPDDKNRRTGIRLNASREYGRLKVALNTNYVQQNYNLFDSEGMSDFNSSQNVGLNQGLMNLLFNTAGYIDLQKYKDFENNPYASYNYYYTDYGLNPYFAIDNFRKTGRRADFLANLNLEFKVADWMSLNYRAGITSQSTDERRISKGETPNSYGTATRGFNPIASNLEERSFRSQRLSSELFANFNKQINDDFKITGVLGTYLRGDNGRDTRVGAVSLVVPDLNNISQRTGNLTGSSPFRQSRLFALYGSAALSYKGWANVEVTGRNEKTSVLSDDNNSYFYPGVSASFVLTDAIDALKNSNILSYLKLRGGWNKTANADLAAYSLAATFSQGGGFPYGTVPGYAADNTVYDPLLRPEFIQNTEVGLEAGFLKNRINIEATYFRQSMTDQIVPINLSSATGYTTANVNAASFINKGFELDLGLTPLVNLGQVRINFKANATYNTSDVTQIYPGLDQISIGGYTYAGNYAIKGYPAFVIRATDYVRDSEGRVIVNSLTGAPTADPNTKIYGNTLPKWIVGLNPSIRWKGLSVSALFEYKGGYMNYNDIGNAMSWTGVSALSGINNRERFIFPNSSVLVNGQYVANTNVTLNNPETFFTGVARSVATNYITSAASWRFRELSIGYDIPVSVFGSQKVIKALNIALTGRNLALWLPKSNQYTDPDFTFSPAAANFGNGSTTGVTTGNQAGISNSSINPPTRTFGGNITITF
ncbi:SusC/RagA family TonB-linked outer membrane protein [Pedobacter sp. 22226]|uniref:SusC/RagA family TonB-linked outer membrane protein n=1 Tax=Pedobacter sp. 22226 TaxID=3453894 RepID=UPI003F861F22